MNNQNMTDGSENFQPFQTKKSKLNKYLKALKDGREFKWDSMPDLNFILGGFERKKLVVIGGRPSEGKSALAVQMAYDFSKKHKVLYLSLEMTEEEAMFRLLCHEKMIPNTDIYRGNLKNHVKKIQEFSDYLDETNRRLIIQEQFGKTWEEVYQIIDHLKDDMPDIIFIDYVQCIQTKSKKLDAIEDYIKNIRKFAIEQNCCIFLLSQINRGNVTDNKEPSMDGLKGSGFLEEHADMIMLCSYPCKKDKKTPNDRFKILVEKNKNGMTGFHSCGFKPEHYKFYEYESDKILEVKRVDWND